MQAIATFEMPEYCGDCPCYESLREMCALTVTSGMLDPYKKPLYCPLVECPEGYILLGKEYWQKHFEIYSRTWTTEDGDGVDGSFMVEKKND